jgi:DNA primase
MGLIPEDIISQVIDRCDIVEIISSYIPLKRTGQNYKACCPFHHEKTPSFIVSSQKQIYHCFGCGEGGNVISFVMKQERLEFPEAIRFLAQKVNIEIPQTGNADSPQKNLRHLIYKLNQFAAQYYHQRLISDKSKEAVEARRYVQKRGMDLNTVKDFQLGFAPDRWDGLINYLKQRDVSLKLMEKAGLIVPRHRGGGYYDRFRNRIIFPILDRKSDCRAFGGRDLSGQSGAKYMNSPETPVYVKGRHLYGLHLAKTHITQQDCVMITEGYMDCITPYQNGVKNIVASLGTALTVDQVRLLKRYTRNVVMLFDTDPAGESALLRSLDMLVEEGMEVKIATLEQGEDPDSFIRLKGVAAFNAKVREARPLFDYKYQFLVNRYNRKEAAGKARIAGELLPTIYKFKDQIRKSEYLKSLAHRLNVDENILIIEFNKVGDSLTDRLSQTIQKRQQKSKNSFSSTEHHILKLLLQEERFIQLTKQEMPEEDFQDEKVRQVISRIYRSYETGQEFDVGRLISSFQDASIQKMLSQLMFAEEAHQGDTRRMHQDYLKRIKRDRRKEKAADIKRQIREAEQAQNETRLNALMKEFNQLMTKKL